MTQPAAPTQQQNQQQAAALAAVLAAGATVGSVASLAALAGVSTAVASAVLTLSGTPAPITGAVAGPASQIVAAAEPAYRAAYLLAAARRVKASIDGGATPEQAVAAERRYALAHRAAQSNRRATAVAVDKQTAKHGTVLGWKAVMDSRTSAECRAADRKNFNVLIRPLIGYPGSVHPHCRCRPVAPFAGAGWVDDMTAAATQTRRKAAVA